MFLSGLYLYKTFIVNSLGIHVTLVNILYLQCMLGLCPYIIQYVCIVFKCSLCTRDKNFEQI